MHCHSINKYHIDLIFEIRDLVAQMVIKPESSEQQRRVLPTVCQYNDNKHLNEAVQNTAVRPCLPHLGTTDNTQHNCDAVHQMSKNILQAHTRISYCTTTTRQ